MDETAYALFRRGSALLAEGMLTEAVESLSRARSLEPGKASIREALARAYFGLGQTGKAEEEFAAAADIDPTNDYAHYGLALCLTRQGRVVRARGHARMAYAMRPRNDDYRGLVERLERMAGDSRQEPAS